MGGGETFNIQHSMNQCFALLTLRQRRYGTQPRVGAQRLPWVNVQNDFQPQRGCIAFINDLIQPLQG